MKKIQIFSPGGDLFFEEAAALKVLAGGFRFIAGPLWHTDGYLLFSDTLANKIFQVYPNGVMHVLLHQSGGPCITFTHLSDKTGSNGLALDSSKNVIFCQAGNHGIARLEGKNFVQLCTSYNGRPFNSPNDLVVNTAGDIYFTDPPYGLKNQVLNPEVYQPHSGIYLFKNNQVILLATDLRYPAGVCFSKDEKYLFVSSNHPGEKMILRYEVDANGMLGNKTVFAPVNANGIKMDTDGNLFTATIEGLLIISPAGEKLALISLPDMATNVAFGGKENGLLFITTPTTVYQLSLRTKQPFIKSTASNEKPAKKLNSSAAVS